MTDADRLREAAFTLECWRDERANTEYTAPYWDAPYEQYEAVAALLRAVADADRDLTHGVPSCVTLPALALADTILGMTE
jgi:hypothetical protein